MSFSNIPDATLEQAQTIIEALIPHAKRPVFLWGPFGVGKSSMVQSVVASLTEQTGHHWQLIDARAAQLAAVDTRGIPSISEENFAEFTLPGWLPRTKRDGEYGILFLDELLLGSTSTQAAFYQLINDRCLGDYVLPEGWKIVVASNRPCDGAGVHGRQDAALLTRFETHLNIVPALTPFLEYATSAGWAPEVIAFLAARGRPVLDGNGEVDQPGMLHEYPDGGVPKGHVTAATPRTWEAVSEILRAGLPRLLEQIAINGAIGVGAGSEFAGFLSIVRALPDAGLILSDPDSVDVPGERELATHYAITMILAQRCDATTIDNAASYLARINEELLSVFFMIAGNRDSNLKACESYVQHKLDTQHLTL
mgnify:CR=1 FL=1